MSRVIYIEAGGTNYEIGYRIGVGLREKLIPHNRSRQAFYRKIAKKHNSPLQNIIARSEKLVSTYFPEFLEELNGLAAGSSIPLKDILLLGNEETIQNGAANKCTTFAYDGRQSVILGHNEDWAPGYEDKLAKQILRNHANQPCTICAHPQTRKNSCSQTVGSAIVNLSEMSLSVTLGNPCRSRYQKFYF